MSRKDRKGDAAVGPHREGTPGAVQWLLDRRQFRDALKQAKLCFRAADSAENRELLERIYVLRVRDLADQTMPQAAAEVAKDLLAFGISSDPLLLDLVGLLPRLGLAAEATQLASRLNSPKMQEQLSTQAIDWAVRNPGGAIHAPAEVRDNAARVRDALTALAAGREAEALELLQGFGRQSPWADWRYFVRGLAAHYRGDGEAATANWERLAPNRLAAKIAATLRCVASQAPQPPDPVALTRLERAVFGEPVTERFDRLRKLLLDAGADSAAAWKQAFGAIEGLRRVLARHDIRFAHRLTNVLIEPLCDVANQLPLESAQRLFRDFQKAVEPLPWDSAWHRFMALAWEPQSLTVAVTHWRTFVATVPRVSVWSPQDRQRVEALVWRHIARLLDEEIAREMTDCAVFNFEDLYAEDRPRIDAYRREVVEALETSLRLDPLQRATYTEAMTIYSNWEDQPAQAKIAERQFAAFPDDTAALAFLIEYHLGSEHPQTALDYLQRAKQLRPLDKMLTSQAFRAHAALARQLTLERRFDEARANLDACDALVPESAANFRMCARRAALEFKAKQASRAAEYIAAGLAKAAAPVSFYHCMSVQSHCYKLPKMRQTEFESLWKKELARRKSGAAASEMAKTMIAVLFQKMKYSEREAHVTNVIDYLQKTTRTRYSEAELRDVCEFLDLADVGERWFEMLARRGSREFTRNPFFPRFLGRIALRDDRNPRRMYRAEKHLQVALRLAQADAQYSYLLEAIKSDLADVEVLKQESLSTSLFARGFGLGFDDDNDKGDERNFLENDELEPSVIEVIQKLLGGRDPSSLPPHIRTIIEQLLEQERAGR